MIYAILFFLLLSAASFALSLGLFIATARATTSESFLRHRFAAAAHTGWGIIYMAVAGLLLIAHGLAAVL